MTQRARIANSVLVMLFNICQWPKEEFLNFPEPLLWRPTMNAPLD